jgi:hypothetical protein
VARLVDDPSPHVRRECALALRHHSSGQAPRLWAQLAARHDGQDRWYLEALGIGADKQWDACLAAWLDRVGDDWNTPAGRDIIWRSRAAITPTLLGKIISDPRTAAAELPRYFRAFDFLTGEARDRVIAELALGPLPDDEARAKVISLEATRRVRAEQAASDPAFQAALGRTLDWLQGTGEFILWRCWVTRPAAVRRACCALSCVARKHRWSCGDKRSGRWPRSFPLARSGSFGRSMNGGWIKSSIMRPPRSLRARFRLRFGKKRWRSFPSPPT